MKKLLLLGALISSVAMAANTVELRAGAYLIAENLKEDSVTEQN